MIELPSGILPEDAKFLMAVKLFETEKLSIGQAAKLAGYSKATFIELVSKLGVAVVNYSPEDLAQEMLL
jgi:predicted HTH domain antitoxin